MSGRKRQGKPTIGVLILNRNGKDWLPPLYEALRRQRYERLRIYLLDNASDDGSVELTRTGFPEVHVIRFSENLGYCMAYNQAMPVALGDGCDWVVWSNNDVLLEEGCLDELAAASLLDERIGVVGPAFKAWDGEEPNYYMQGMHAAAIPAMLERRPEPIDVEWVEGSFLMVSALCVKSVGWLDPFLFFYWEETDFCRRARRKGWRVALAPRALARHYAGGWSAGNSANMDSANGLKSRNLYIYTLADPGRAFARNLLEAGHLFLVLVKAAMKASPARLDHELRAFGRLLPELGEIHRKWRRDRDGGGPEAIDAKHRHVRMVVLPSRDA